MWVPDPRWTIYENGRAEPAVLSALWFSVRDLLLLWIHIEWRRSLPWSFPSSRAPWMTVDNGSYRWDWTGTLQSMLPSTTSHRKSTRPSDRIPFFANSTHRILSILLLLIISQIWHKYPSAGDLVGTDTITSQEGKKYMALLVIILISLGL